MTVQEYILKKLRELEEKNGPVRDIQPVSVTGTLTGKETGKRMGFKFTFFLNPDGTAEEPETEIPDLHRPQPPQRPPHLAPPSTVKAKKP